MTSEESPTPARFVVGDSSFECVENVPNWKLMKLASAMNSGDDMRAMGEMYDFVTSLVIPAERGRLDEHLSSIDLDGDILENAIGDALVEMAGRGKGRPATPGRVPQDHLSGRSSGGSQAPATPTRRVVSLSQGTVTFEPEAPTG